MSQFFKVSITQLKISRPFLKVFARNLKGRHVEELKKLKDLYEKTEASDIEVGEMAVAKLSASQFERCRILKSVKASGNAFVYFIDSGCFGNIKHNQLRTLEDENIRCLKQQCQEFVLGKIMLTKNVDNRRGLEKLHDMLLAQSFEMEIIDSNEVGKYIDLRLADASLFTDIIPNDIVLNKIIEAISIDIQKTMMLTKKQENDVADYKIETLNESPEVKVMLPKFPAADTFFVKITAFDDDINSFYVRYNLKAHECRKFVLEVNSLVDSLVPLRLAGNHAAYNTLCLTQYDNRIYRARILQDEGKLRRNFVKIQLLETGEKFQVNINRLFKIPEKIAAVPPYAKRFKLVPFTPKFFLSDLELSFYFKYITNDKILSIKPSEDSGETPAIPSCELYDGDQCIVDKISAWNPHSLVYSQQPALDRNKVYNVFCCSVTSPTYFYVQLDDLEEKYEDLDKKLLSIRTPPLSSPKVGNSCVVFNGKERFRGLVTKQVTQSIFKVRFVDNGFEEEFEESEIYTTLEELLELPPCAYLCCLHEYKNEEASSNIENEFFKICSTNESFQMTINSHSRTCLVVEMKASATGMSINQMLQDAEHKCLNTTDWSEQPSSMSQNFGLRAMTRKHNDTVHSLTESPDRTCLHKSSWDDTLKEATILADWNDVPRSSSPQHNRSSSVKTMSDSNCIYRSKTSLSMFWKNPSNKNTSSSSSGVSSSKNDFNVANVESVRVTSVTTMQDFTVQKEADDKKYQIFCQELQIRVKDQKQLTKVTEKEFCLAFHPFDKMWCRAVVVEAGFEDSFFVSVKCVDDGTSFSVTDEEDLKVASVVIMKEPFFGIRCSLAVTVFARREYEASSYLIRNMSSCFNYQEIVNIEGLHFVELFHKGQNLTDFLVENGLGKRLFVAPTGSAYISHIVSTENFSIQMTTDSDALHRVLETTENYSRRDVEQPRVGMLVFARFKTDGRWYRAKIQSKEEIGFTVYLVDLGYATYVDEIGAIDVYEMEKIPPIAIRCSLDLPPNFKTIAHDAEEKFKSIASNGNKKVDVKTIRPSVEHALVVVYVGGNNILDILLPSSSNQQATADDEEF